MLGQNGNAQVAERKQEGAARKQKRAVKWNPEIWNPSLSSRQGWHESIGIRCTSLSEMDCTAIYRNQSSELFYSDSRTANS